jgi:hypothetical protein
MSDTIFQFTKKDLTAGVIYEPAWYRVRIDEVSAEPSKNTESPSTNYWIQGTLLFNADTGDRKYEDHPIRWNFNSKWMNPAKGFVMALGTPEEEITENTRFEFKASIGKELDVYIENGLWENRPNNKVNHKYRMPRVSE